MEAVTGRDKLVSIIYEAARAIPASADERMKAIIRAGELARVYVNEPLETIEAIFGSECGDGSNTIKYPASYPGW